MEMCDGIACQLFFFTDKTMNSLMCGRLDLCKVLDYGRGKGLLVKEGLSNLNG